jgi:hypothetical protein
MAIIGLLGFIGSGKDTVSDILVEDHGFIKESFAGSVKDAVSTIFGWDRSLLEGDTEESRNFRETPDAWWSDKFGAPVTPRNILQLMGTESCRNVFHTDIWIFATQRRICIGKNYVISDVRFPNEMHFIRSMGGKIIRVSRGKDPEWYYTALKQNTTHEDDLWILQDKNELMEQMYPQIHSSEWACIGFESDAHIHNDNTLEELRNKVKLSLDTLYKTV